MAFQFLDKDVMRKIITSTMIRSKLKYAKVIWSLHKKMHMLKLERIKGIATKMVSDLLDLTYEERLKEMQLTTLKERRERGNFIIIYKLMNNLEETDRKYLIMKRKGEARCLRGHKKLLQTGICVNKQRSKDTWNGLKEEVVMAKNL